MNAIDEELRHMNAIVEELRHMNAIDEELRHMNAIDEELRHMNANNRFKGPCAHSGTIEYGPEFTNIDTIDDNRLYLPYIFRSPGLIWMEQQDGVFYFKHTFLGPSEPNTKAFTIARTVRDAHTFTHFDVDIGNNTLVAVDKKQHKLVAMTFPPRGLTHKWTLYEGISDKVNGIAIDWTTDVIYWTDATYDVILAASLSDYNRAEPIVDSGLDEPYAIAVHPQKGYLFWSDVDANRPRIMRSYLDGHNVTELYSLPGQKITQLVIDHANQRLYWLYDDMGRGGRGILHSASIYGGQAIETSPQIIQNLDTFDIFQGQMYFSRRKNLYVKTFGRKTSEVVYLNLPVNARNLVLINKQKQKNRPNACLGSPCPGLCTLSRAKTSCLCKDRSTLDSLETQLCDRGDFTGIILGKGDGIYTMKRNFIEYQTILRKSETTPRNVLYTGNPVKAVASDAWSNSIFIYEYPTQVIQSIHAMEHAEAKVISLAIGKVGAMACDSVGKNLYWTDSSLGHIMVARQDGRYQYVLHQQLKKPMALAVHSIKSLLFWSELGTGTLHRSFLDGSQRKTMALKRRYSFYAITVDYKSDILYLCERQAIYGTTIDGAYPVQLYHQHQHMFTGITVFHDYLLLSDMHYTTSGLHVFQLDNRQLQYLGKRPLGKAEHTYFDFGNWYGITYHHKSAQPKPHDVCSSAKCDQLCLPGDNTATCVCELGYNRQSDQCQISPPVVPFLLVADQRYSRLLQVHGGHNEHFVSIPVQRLQQPYSLTYDSTTDMVYWSDLELHTISRAGLDGSNQEILVYDPTVYFTDLVLEPGSCLLFYFSIYGDRLGSITAYHVETGNHYVILNDYLEEPTSLTLHNGQLFFLDNGAIWRIDVDGGDLKRLLAGIQATAIAVIDNFIYFANEITSVDYGDMASLTEMFQCVQDGSNITFPLCDQDGSNVTCPLFELSLASVQSMAVDQNFLYWTNSSTRSINRIRLQESDMDIEVLGSTNVLFKPTDLFINIIREDFQRTCSVTACGGMYFPAPSGRVCREEGVTTRPVTLDNSGFCQIPDIANGKVDGNTVGNVVPGGFTASVDCLPAHRITNASDIVCTSGNWSHIPHCELEYDICGDAQNGYKVYRESGQYFVYPGVTRIGVICIGGGGGGYNVADRNIANFGKAGDGGLSSFGNRLKAFGGKGGTPNKGGDGGDGHTKGGNGSVARSYTCRTGGTAGRSPVHSNTVFAQSSNEPFCGSGGYSYGCKAETMETARTQYAGPGGTDGNVTSGGMFGGGAGSRGGGTGGGGGWSRLLTMHLQEKELIHVTVGHAGSPSYGRAAPGVVVVMWGTYRSDASFVGNYTTMGGCVTLQ